MRQKQHIFYSILVVLLSTINAKAQNYSGGSGTTGDPYQIANKADLKYLSENSSEWDKHFIQTANIVFTTADFTSGGDFHNSGAGFNPIGNETTTFIGNYNGGGHTIDGLYINRPTQNYIGFFGHMNLPVFISNLGITNATITGSERVGALAGNNSGGNISKSFASGSVTGNTYVGGLVGGNGGGISNSYATSSVTGSVTYVGGLVGHNTYYGVVSNSYATGLVSTPPIINAGGLIGNNIGTVTNSFYDTNTTGQSDDNGKGTPKTTAEMLTQSTFTNANWDFTNGTGDWIMGSCIIYPKLSWQTSITSDLLNGEGTTTNPYQISTKTNLKVLSENSCLWDKHFIQTENIVFDATDFTFGGDFYNGGAGFNPIGNTSTNFTGTYNGGGYSIDGLVINRPAQNYIGLFGRINGSSAEISNLNVINATITGDITVGGLVGRLGYGTVTNSSIIGSITGSSNVGGSVGYSFYGTIENTYSTGSVTLNGTNSYVGGLVGYNFYGTISTSYAMSSVSGSNYVGGLVGSILGTVENCYASGSVSGSSNVGGLVGDNYEGLISNSYATGSVSGSNDVGGLVGHYEYGTVSNSFYDTETTGQTTSAGGTGKTTTQMQTESTFTSAGWDFTTTPIWKMGNCATNNDYPILDWQTLNPAVSVSSNTQTNVSCNGGNDGSATVLANGGTGSYTYSWNDTASQTTVTANNLIAGSYTVTVTDANGCAATQNFTITQPTAVSVSSDTQTNVSCNGGNDGSATVSANGGTGSYTYSWNDTASQTTATANNLVAGSYTVTVTDANGCEATQSFIITEPTPLDDTISENTTGIITANEDDATATYQWYNCSDNSVISGATTQSYEPSVIGEYKVTVTVGTCSVTSACYEVTTLATRNFEVINTIKVYPNPSTGIFSIATQENVTIEVYDLIGKIIVQKAISIGTNSFDISSYASGVYLLKATNDSGNVNTYKIIKQ